MSDAFGWEFIDLASAPPLLPGEVHIYATRLSPDPEWQTTFGRVLDTDESERAARFRFDEDRYRFQKTRAALRLIIGHYLATAAERIDFREGSHGKPYLKDPGTDLQFNVSHTKGAAVLAFAHDVEIGIDIEHARRKVDVEGVGRRVFTRLEQDGLRKLGEASALREFFRLWTAKEAYLKATGSGLSVDPASIEANLERGQFSPAGDELERLPYALKELETANHFQVCIAHQDCAPPSFRMTEFR